MRSRSIDLPVVTFSTSIYRLLLMAYPGQFQQEYGLEMVQTFRDCCLRTLRQSGVNGMFRLWFITLLDLLQSVVMEHTQKAAQVKKEMNLEDVQRAGSALILGAISFVASIFLAVLEYRNWSMFGLLLLLFVSLPLFVFGLLGLRTRYGERTGGFGRSILLIGAILGPLTSIIGFFLMSSGDPLWLVIWAGPAVLFLCLTLFGVAAFHMKPMPRWNMLPIPAGLSYPAIILFQIVHSLTTGDWSAPGLPYVVIMILIILQGIALLALGYILRADVREEKIITVQ